MTADNLRFLAVQGASQVAVTAWHVLQWPLAAAGIALPLIILWRLYRRRRDAARWAELRREPCPCCTTSPRESDDCTCREDCGVPWCQAADPPDHIEGCGPGRNLLAYPSLACPACDWTAARTEARDDTQPWPAPRPECPWCDTHECIDRTLCNCAGPCGSWLCVAKEADRA